MKYDLNSFLLIGTFHEDNGRGGEKDTYVYVINCASPTLTALLPMKKFQNSLAKPIFYSPPSNYKH